MLRTVAQHGGVRVILVVGSSGLLGGMVARRLLERGSSVRLLVRDASPALEGAEEVRGDLKDRASLDAACRGVSTIVTTANSAQRGGEDDVESVDHRGNIALIDAATAAGVKHFVFVSAAAADESSPVPLFAAKGRVERHLSESGMRSTVLAPHIFMDVWFPLIVGSALAAGRPVSLVDGGQRRHSFIAAEDVAAFAVAAVRSDALNERLLLGGPEALSWTEVVGKVSAIAGRKIETVTIAPGAPIPTLPPPVDQVIGIMAAGLEQQDVVIDSRTLATRFGVTMTPAETVLRRMLA
jgi:uncharacterized protein YbjT (DUF2867 family)